MGSDKGPGNIDQTRRGTELVHKHGFTHAGQPGGKSVHKSAPVKVHKTGYHRSDHHHDLVGQHKKY
jgi:hypothetical protein